MAEPAPTLDSLEFLLQAQSDANLAEFDEDAAVERENALDEKNRAKNISKTQDRIRQYNAEIEQQKEKNKEAREAEKREREAKEAAEIIQGPSEFQLEIQRLDADIEYAQYAYAQMRFKKEKGFAEIYNYLSDKKDGVFNYFSKKSTTQEGVDDGQKKEKTVMYEPLAKKNRAQKALETDEEIQRARQYYKDKVNQKAKLILEDARSKGAKPEDLAMLMAEFLEKTDIDFGKQFDEARTSVYGEGKLHKITNGLMRVTDYYRELPLEKKVAFGAGFAVAGGAALWSGGIIASAFLGAAAVKRGFMSAVGGTGAYKIAGAMQHRKKIKNIREEVSQFTEKTKEMSEDERMALLMQRFALAGENADAKFAEAKKDKWKRKGIGFGVGATIFCLPLIGRGLSNIGHSEVVTSIAEKLGYSDAYKAHGVGPSLESFEHPGAGPLIDMREAGPQGIIHNSAPEMINAHMTEQIHPTSIEIPKPTLDANGCLRQGSVWSELKQIAHKLHPGVSEADLNEYTRTMMYDTSRKFALEHHITPAEAMAEISKMHSGSFDVTYDAHGMAHLDVSSHSVLKDVIAGATNAAALGSGVYMYSKMKAEGTKIKNQKGDAAKIKAMEKLIGDQGFITGMKNTLNLLTKNVRKEDRHNFWRNEIKNASYEEAIKNPQAKEAIQEILEQYKKVLGKKEAKPLDKQEPVGRWLSRIVQQTVDLNEALKNEN